MQNKQAFDYYIPLQNKDGASFWSSSKKRFWLSLLFIIPFGVILIGLAMASQVINSVAALPFMNFHSAIAVAIFGFFFWAAIFGKAVLQWWRSLFSSEDIPKFKMHRHHSKLEQLGTPNQRLSGGYHGSQHLFSAATEIAPRDVLYIHEFSAQLKLARTKIKMAGEYWQPSKSTSETIDMNDVEAKLHTRLLPYQQANEVLLEEAYIKKGIKRPDQFDVPRIVDELSQCEKDLYEADKENYERNIAIAYPEIRKRINKWRDNNIQKPNTTTPADINESDSTTKDFIKRYTDKLKDFVNQDHNYSNKIIKSYLLLLVANHVENQERRSFPGK